MTSPLIQTPFTVNTKSGDVKLFIVDKKGPLSTGFALMATVAEQKVLIRIAGGCKGMDNADKQKMADFFVRSFSGFKGVMQSGGTRMITSDNEIDLMVTEIPGLVAKQNVGVVSLGTAPRVSIISLKGESIPTLDDYGTILNPGQDGVMVVQDGPDDSVDWDGDVDMYLKMLGYLRDFAQFKIFGLVSWNGGAVTAREIKEFAKRGLPVFLIEGSGRITDEMIKGINDKDEKVLTDLNGAKNIFIVAKDDPEGFHKLLVDLGFITE